MHFEGGGSHLGVIGPKRQKLDAGDQTGAAGGGDKGCKLSPSIPWIRSNCLCLTMYRSVM